MTNSGEYKPDNSMVGMFYDAIEEAVARAQAQENFYVTKIAEIATEERGMQNQAEDVRNFMVHFTRVGMELTVEETQDEATMHEATLTAWLQIGQSFDGLSEAETEEVCDLVKYLLTKGAELRQGIIDQAPHIRAWQAEYEGMIQSLRNDLL